MIAVGASEHDVTPLLTDGVAIAAVNAPNSLVISGAEVLAGEVAGLLGQRGARVHRLAVSHAFHSPLMEPMIEEFTRLAAGVAPDQPRISVVSNITGQLASTGYGTGQYWAEHVRQPVRFVDSVRFAEIAGRRRICRGGSRRWSDRGGRTVVERAARRSSGDADSRRSRSRNRYSGRPDGCSPPEWTWTGRRALTHLGARRVELPTYGFARRRFLVGVSGKCPAADGESIGGPGRAAGITAPRGTTASAGGVGLRARGVGVGAFQRP